MEENMTSLESFGASLVKAFENDLKRAEARIDLVNAQPVPNLMLISIACKGGQRGYVTGCSYDDGPGYSIGKIKYGRREKALRFKAEHGLDIARQLAGIKFGGIDVQMENVGFTGVK